ncbi:PASTA domain-containing protein, partial [Clavibacter michiganensis]|uniref:PASTA domain-containing protein n=1 Tax=Clavibacter michiganensis TaxID=28447 RepID=UPI00292CF424
RRTRTALGLSAAAAVIALAGWGAIASIETTAEVPAAVAGQEQADVASALSAAGFTTATREEFSTAVPAGKVIGTEPAAGTEQRQSAVADVLVSVHSGCGVPAGTLARAAVCGVRGPRCWP